MAVYLLSIHYFVDEGQNSEPGLQTSARWQHHDVIFTQRLVAMLTFLIFVKKM